MHRSVKMLVLVVMTFMLASAAVMSGGCRRGGGDSGAGPGISASGSGDVDGTISDPGIGSDSGVAADPGASSSSDANISGTAGADSVPAILSSIELTPVNPLLALGTTLQLTATGTYSDDSTQDITSSVAWSSSDANIAVISETGMVTGVSAGTATLSATDGDVSISVTVTVTAASLISISVTPTNPQIAKGTTMQFTATGYFSDNSTQDLSTQVAWSSSNTDIATVNNAGTVTGTDVGSVTITAETDGISASTTLTVTSATLVSIALSPVNAKIALGTSQQFTATATFTDDSTQDLTAQVTWSSSDNGKATIGNAGGLKGKAVSASTGSVTITAAYGGKSATATLTVTAATLVSISISPDVVSLPLGLTHRLIAMGHYSDNTTQDLTGLVTWISSNSVVASIGNSSLAKGLVCSLAHGSTLISAIDPVTKITSVSVTVTVTSAVLQSLAIAPSSLLTKALGLTHQLTCIGTYSDNTTQDLTNAVTWLTSNSAIVGISNVTKGLAVTLSVGSAQITVVDPVSQLVSAPVEFSVTNAILQSIAVTPGTLLSKALGLTQQFTAIGTYSDNTTQDITNLVTWLTSNDVVAGISNVTKGLAITLTVGSTQITAVDPATQIVSAPTAFTVTNAVLKTISITSNVLSAALGLTEQLHAVGLYSDNTTQDITAKVTWKSSNGTIASVSNSSPLNGLLSTLLAGTTQITAVDPVTQVVSSPLPFTVTNAILKSIAVTPGTLLSKALGLAQQFTAVGTYSDNTTQDITKVVTWLTSNGAVAGISNSDLTKGLASTLLVGSTQISALDPVTQIASGPVTFTVTSAILKTISITSSVLSTALGLTQQLVAIGTYSDNSTQDITNAVTWKSSNGSVASISNSAPLNGLLSTLLAGTTQVTAIDPVSQLVSAPVAFSVTNALLKSIAISPINPSILLGLTKQFKAIGTFTDGTTQDVTKSVTWLSSNGLVANISNLTSSKGLASGLLLGTSSITAIDPVTKITSQTSILSILLSLLGGLL